MGWFGEVPHLIEEDEWDEGLALALEAIERDGGLSAFGFANDVGSVEDFKPVRAKRTGRKPVSRPARPAPLPVLPPPAVRHPRPDYSAQIAAAALNTQLAERQERLARAMHEARAARLRAEQEQIGMQWATTQLQNITYQINIFRMQGDTYRAELMKQAARQVISAYPGLYELQSAAALLGLT